MTVLLGTILSPGGVPVTGTLWLQLSQDATLNGGLCGSGLIAARPPFIFNLTDGVISGPGAGAYTVPGADCLTPAGLTYHMSVTGSGGEVVVERDVAITGASVDLGAAVSVVAAGQALPGLAGDVTGPASITRVVGLQGRALLSTAPATGQVLGWGGSAWGPLVGVASGFLRADGTTPLTADWSAGNFNIDSRNSRRLFNALAYGADPTGALDSKAAINAAIAAATAAGGGIVQLPHGQLRVIQTGSTVPFVITAGNIIVQGEGAGATNISFEPSGGGAVFQFNNGAVPINYNGIRDLSFRSPDSTTQKTMILAYDLNNFFVQRISNTPGLNWTGSGSIGIRFRGRQELRTQNCALVADFPVVIDENPNLSGANEISFDHSSVEQSDLLVSNYAGTGTFTNGTTAVSSISPSLPGVNTCVGWIVAVGAVTGVVASNTTTSITLTGNWTGSGGAQSFRANAPNHAITILDGTVLTNVAFRDLAFVCGTGGILANSTTPGTAWQNIRIENCRTEQTIDPAAYSLDIRHSGAQVQCLSVRGFSLDGNMNGVRLTGCQWPVLESVLYGGTGTFVNFSASVNAPVVAYSFQQTGSTRSDSSTNPTALVHTVGGNAPYTNFGSLEAPKLSGTVFTQTNTVTLTNTPTETTLLGTGVGSLTLPADLFVAGRTIRITLAGTIASALNNTIQYRLKIGGVTFDTSVANSMSAITVDFLLEAVFTCRTTGSGGTGFGVASIKYGTPVASSTFNSAGSTALNTTGTLAVNVTGQWGGTDAGDILNVYAAIVEILN